MKLNYLAKEFFLYKPGMREIAAGWRETSNYLRSKKKFFKTAPHYIENSYSTVIS